MFTNNPNNVENDYVKQIYENFNIFVPLKPEMNMLPDFPVECLPEGIRDYVVAVAHHTQTPVDMAAGVALGILAICLQGKIRVEGNIGHYEQTSLYVLIVAPPGSRKSSVIHEMTSVIEDHEEAYNEKLQPLIRKRNQERESLQRQISRLSKRLETKPDDMEELELQNLQDKLADLPPIHPLQMFTGDCTSEMLEKLLNDNGGRMAVISAEGGIFDNICGRYSKKPNTDVWLKGISGDTIRVDRLNRDPDYIRNPALSAIISAQPSVLSDIMSNSMLDGRGFLARFLYVNVPEGNAPKTFRSEPIDPMIRENYRALIFRLLNWKTETPATLHLSEDAVTLMESFCEKTECFLMNDGRDLREWGSKFIGMTLKIAGLIHIASGQEGEISGDTVRKAISIGQYALSQARYAYSMMGNDEMVEKAMMLLSRVRKVGMKVLSRSQLYQMCRGRYFREAKDMEPVLELLEQHGYLYVHTPAYNGVGRPSAGYVYFLPSIMSEKNS